jgi:PAS domain S-box-containing protein
MATASSSLFGRAEETAGSSAPPSSDTNTAPPELDVGLLFDRLLDAVVIARVSSGRIALWNPAAEKLFGFTAQEAVGQSVELLMPEAIAHVHRAGLERYRRTGHGLIIDAGTTVEMPACTKNGENMRIEMSLSVVDDARGERFAVAIMRDAMHRKRLELTNLQLAQARVARTEAEAALAEREELFDALAETLQAASQPDQLEHFSAQLEEFKRLDRGQRALALREADLVDLVHSTLDDARRRAAGRRLIVRTPPRAPANLDPDSTLQALEHVMDEAIQRGTDGSRIEVTVDVPSPETVQLTVRAEGTPAATRGLGVGIYLSRMLMRSQGGALTARLTPGGGSEVELSLPACPHPTRPARTRTRSRG